MAVDVGLVVVMIECALQFRISYFPDERSLGDNELAFDAETVSECLVKELKEAAEKIFW